MVTDIGVADDVAREKHIKTQEEPTEHVNLVILKAKYTLIQTMCSQEKTKQ